MEAKIKAGVFVAVRRQRPLGEATYWLQQFFWEVVWGSTDSLYKLRFSSQMFLWKSQDRKLQENFWQPCATGKRKTEKTRAWAAGCCWNCTYYAFTLTSSKKTWKISQRKKRKDFPRISNLLRNCFKGQCNKSMTWNYIWNLLRESKLEYNCQFCREFFF